MYAHVNIINSLLTYLLKGIPPINLVNLDPDQARRNAGLIWIQTGRHSARGICLKQFIDVHSMWGWEVATDKTKR